MAGNWYKTGTAKVTKGSAVVTGTGTAWADNKQGIGPGQMFLVPGSGTVLMFEILSVDSNTQLTLASTFTGTTATAAAYAIPSFYVDSVPDFARRLAAQLSYYQSQMDGWQQIMTGTGTIALTAPDGTTVNLSSFAKLTADMASKAAKGVNSDITQITGLTTMLAVSQGGTGANTESLARTKLGVGYFNGLANPGAGVVRFLRYDDSGLMIITRRFLVSAAATSSTGWSYSWQSELSVGFTTYPALSVSGSGANSADWRVGTEGEGGGGCSGFIRNNNAATISVWVTVIAIGIKA